MKFTLIIETSNDETVTSCEEFVLNKKNNSLVVYPEGQKFEKVTRFTVFDFGHNIHEWEEQL